MSNTISKVIGIDLGTTYSCVSYVDEHGKAVVIPNFEGERTTPSVAFFDEESIIIGREAKNSLSVYPEKVVSFIKRSMGDEHFLFQHKEQDYRPELISSFILKKLVDDANKYLNEEINDVVITCPAYFGINEREATKKAGEIAGLNVINIINEPTAAAIAYADKAKLNGNTLEDKVVLVYDLGGGTFDISMIKTGSEEIRVIVTGGDHQLGGKDWDDCIINYLAEQFKEEHGISEDLLTNPETAEELRSSAEKAKMALTARPKTMVIVQHEGDRSRIELTKEKFEELTEALLSRTVTLTRAVLADAEKEGSSEFDEIILVGGSVKMPQIKNRIDAEFNVDAKIFEPDEAVAKGAALYGFKHSLGEQLKIEIAEATGQKIEEVHIKEVDESVLEQAEQKLADRTGLMIGEVKKARTVITNVTSKSFGVIAIDALGANILSNLILRNKSVPAEITKRFGTHLDNQMEVSIIVMENELNDDITLPSNGKEIGETILHMPANLPAGTGIDITFKINEEGRLDIKAIEETEGREITAIIQTTSVIQGEELAEAIEISKGLIIS